MKVFDIYVNHRKVCTAGLNQAGVVSSVLTWGAGHGKHVRKTEHLEFRVGGLISRSRTFVEWFKRPLHSGDEIRIVIATRRSADAPKKKRRESKADRLKRERRMLEARAAALGFKVVGR